MYTKTHPIYSSLPYVHSTYHKIYQNGRSCAASSSDPQTQNEQLFVTKQLAPTHINSNSTTITFTSNHLIIEHSPLVRPT